MLDLRMDTIECGPGWVDIIWEALEKVEQTKSYQELKKEGWKIPIIKEKYGVLEIQTWQASEEIWEIFKEARTKSSTVCEMKGCPSEVRGNGGWLSTICDDCREQMKNN